MITKVDFLNFMGKPPRVTQDVRLRLTNFQATQDFLSGNTDAPAIMLTLRCEWHGKRRLSLMRKMYTRLNQLRFARELGMLQRRALVVPRGRSAVSDK